jgi:hypothetical protein
MRTYFLAGQHYGGHFCAIDVLNERGQGSVATCLLDLEGSEDKVFIQEIGGVTVTVNEIACHVVWLGGLRLSPS